MIRSFTFKSINNNIIIVYTNVVFSHMTRYYNIVK
nr:MAG TPA: hypothetical protein [Caudoviricetes sp.]DAR51921.1 MAG TPA: hypothetical protein [Caudoviricetes sp.]DAZ82534.1 MAG TPA: hypothetical protein [Caudoviricetes sp.]